MKAKVALIYAALLILLSTAVVSAAPNAPDGVVASNGRYTDRIEVNWDPVPNAQFYSIYRSSEDNPDLRAEEVEQVVDIFFEEIAQRLSEGGRVELRGFGAFSTREREARKGRNPRTGETVDVPAKRVPYFKPGKDMRRRLNDD